jgi:hypothetical protein
MKTLLARALVIVGVLAGGATSAIAQIDQPLKFTTTFPFMVGTKMLPAGTYTIEPASLTNLDVLEVRGDHASAVLSTENAVPPRIDPKQSEVIFDRSGDHYVLTEVWDESSRQGAERIPSRAERIQVAEHARGKE